MVRVKVLKNIKQKLAQTVKKCVLKKFDPLAEKQLKIQYTKKINDYFVLLKQRTKTDKNESLCKFLIYFLFEKF